MVSDPESRPNRSSVFRFSCVLKLSRLRKDLWEKKTWEEASVANRRLRVVRRQSSGLSELSRSLQSSVCSRAQQPPSPKPLLPAPAILPLEVEEYRVLKNSSSASLPLFFLACHDSKSHQKLLVSAHPWHHEASPSTFFRPSAIASGTQRPGRGAARGAEV